MSLQTYLRPQYQVLFYHRLLLQPLQVIFLNPILSSETFCLFLFIKNLFKIYYSFSLDPLQSNVKTRPTYFNIKSYSNQKLPVIFIIFREILKNASVNDYWYNLDVHKIDAPHAFALRSSV